MAEPDAPRGELVHVPALRGAREIEKLAESEVPRMCGDEVEKAGFLLVVTEINEGCEMFRGDAHSDRILVSLCRPNHARHGESMSTCGEQVGETCFGEGRIALTVRKEAG